MGDVVAFDKRDGKRRKRDEAKRRAKGKTLCNAGFHDWSTRRDTRFDVKKGRLVTVIQCTRCGATKNELR